MRTDEDRRREGGLQEEAPGPGHVPRRGLRLRRGHPGSAERVEGEGSDAPQARDMAGDTIPEMPAVRLPEGEPSGTDYHKRAPSDPYRELGPRWWVAALLAFSSSGLGQLYNGRPMRGVACVVLPTGLLLAAVATGSPLLYLVTIWAGAFTAPTLVILLAALAGWVPLDHPAVWMGLPMKAVIVLEAALDAHRLGRLRKVLPRRRWSRFAYSGSLGVLLLVWIFTTGMGSVERPDMNPVLEPGDHVMIDRLAFGLQIPLIGVRLGGELPRRGTRVALLDPQGSGRVIFRRVFALPGDRVAFGPPGGSSRVRLPMLGRAGAAPTPVAWMYWPGPCVYALERERRRAGTRYARCQAFVEWAGRGSYRVSYPLVPAGDPGAAPHWQGTVPRGQIFLLSDNRGGRDGRIFGPVPERRLRGRPHVVLWSRDPLEGIRWHRMGLRVTDQP